MSPASKDWVDITTALLTPTIAIFGSIITWQQWATNRDKLKHELFERRYQVYEKIAGFVANILITGGVEPGKDMQFLVETKSVSFLFNEDIKSLVSEIYQKATMLHALEAELSAEAGEARTRNIEKQRQIKEWYSETLNKFETKFSPFLKLKH
jgi:ribosomal protein L29